MIAWIAKKYNKKDPAVDKGSLLQTEIFPYWFQNFVDAARIALAGQLICFGLDIYRARLSVIDFYIEELGASLDNHGPQYVSAEIWLHFCSPAVRLDWSANRLSASGWSHCSIGPPVALIYQEKAAQSIPIQTKKRTP
jgi:hypothetical protein